MGSFKELLSNIQKDISTDNPGDPTTAEAEASSADEDADKAIKLELLKAKREYNKQLAQNRKERKKYAKHIFVFTCIWATFIFLIIIASGLKKFTQFELSDKVLITLITSTTVNFFGFFLLVVKYLFNTGDKDKAEEDKKKKKPKPKKLKKDEDTSE